MTVRKAISVLTEAKEIFICRNDNLRPFDKNDAFPLW